MNVDIYIRERNGDREIRVPWLPSSIEYESGGVKAATYDILNKGEVAVPSGTGLRRVAWQSIFPGEDRSDVGLQRGTPKSPSHYLQILESWREKGTGLTITVTGYPINFDVFLESYSAIPTGGFGDMQYSISFKEDRDIAITAEKTATVTANAAVRPAKQTTSYTIKKGDTLWAISKKFLGAGSKWKTIYNANKTIIESTAKKYGKKSSNNGWWIYPGVTIQIPK